MTTISIIVPTKGERHPLLRRAMESACVTGGGLNIEIIVVLNGAESHGGEVDSMAADISANRGIRVNVIRVAPSNVSHARNAGIAAASGELIRFLDDDDFLIQSTAKEQYLELLASHGDLSTYAGRIEDESGVTHQTIAPQAAMDYGCAVLGPNCPALTFATVYRTDLIRNIRWNEDFAHTEDEDWMRRVLLARDPAWVTSKDVVGVWYQHRQARLSKPVPVQRYYGNRAVSILDLVRLLKSQGRLNAERREAAANGLWSAIHGGFYFSPIYWTRIARRAGELDCRARPADWIFAVLPGGFPPIVVEWLVLPKRWLNQAWRSVMGGLFGWNSVRKIP